MNTLTMAMEKNLGNASECEFQDSLFVVCHITLGDLLTFERFASCHKIFSSLYKIAFLCKNGGSTIEWQMWHRRCNIGRYNEFFDFRFTVFDIREFRESKF